MNASRRDAHARSASEPVERAFEALPASLAEVRRFVHDQATAWGVDPGDVVLLANELATNAIVHARTPFTISLARRRGRLRLAVADGTAAAPVPRRPPADGRGGRGLLLVERLSRSWGVERTPGGKRVWFEVDC